jgi:carboxypeptidase C (cathepsin A)
MQSSPHYDLATPHFATEYTLNHLGLDAELRSNISTSFYPAGHMMYLHEPSLARLKAELAAFLDAAGA